MNWAFTAESLIPSWHNICPNCNLSGLWDVIRLIPTVCILWYILFSSWDIGQCVLVAVYWKLDWFVFVKSIAYGTLFFICCEPQVLYTFGLFVEGSGGMPSWNESYMEHFFHLLETSNIVIYYMHTVKYPVVFMSMHQTVQFDWDFVLSDLRT